MAFWMDHNLQYQDGTRRCAARNMLCLVCDRNLRNHRKQTAHYLLSDNRSGRLRDNASIRCRARSCIFEVDQMKKLISFVFVSWALLMSSQAWATAYCQGYITNTLTESDGDVLIRSSWRDDWATICNLDQTRQGISPSTCFGWFSSVSSSITENKQVVLSYSGLDQSACATMPTYSNAPVPAYVMLVK